MKEIDLLPTWYKERRRMRSKHRIQYFLAGAVFLILIIWNISMTTSIKSAKADLNQIKDKSSSSRKILNKYKSINQKISSLNEQNTILEKINSRLSMTGLMAELSHLLKKKIIITRIYIKSEKVQKEKGSEFISDSKNSEETSKFKNILYKLVIDGIASRSSDVADLICRLEDSDYFCKVVPAYSKASRMKIERDRETVDKKVTEFRLTCYLNDYKWVNKK